MPTLNQLIKGLRVSKRRWCKTPAFEGSPQRRGVCYKIAIVTPRKPNSARRKIAKVRLSANKRRVFANIPGQGHNLQEYSVVMVEGHGPKDLPGVNYALIRGLLDFVGKESFERRKRRSKFGVKKKFKSIFMKVSRYFDKNFRSIIASAFVQRGLKAKSIKSYQDLLISLKNYGIRNPEQFLKVRLLELQPIINLRSVKLGGIKYKIPYLIKESNQLTFASLWLTRVKGLKKTNQFNLVKAITDNVYQLKDKKGAAYTKQQEWYSTASRNRPYLKYLRD